MQPNGYVKKLKNIGCDMKRTIVVDDVPYSYKENAENAIPIKGWMQSQREDYQLLQVLARIEKIKGCKDVRKGLARLKSDV